VHSRQNLPRQRRDKRQEKSCGGRPHPYFLVGRGGILHGVQLTASPVTPYESWHRRRPYVSNLRFFDSIAYVHVPKEERSKLDKKISRRIFVFYKTTSKAWKGGGIQKAEPKNKQSTRRTTNTNASPTLSKTRQTILPKATAQLLPICQLMAQRQQSTT
jgi:hypothetical protein